MKTYYAKSEFEHYTFRASNISDARYWVIDHLDCSQEWIIGEVINPTSKRNGRIRNTIRTSYKI